MQKNIEGHLHNTLLELANGYYNHKEQALIVAYASYLYNHKTSRFASATVKEAQILDSLLNAIDEFGNRKDDEYLDNIIVKDLSPSDIIHKASQLRPTASKPKNFGNMDILNDDDLNPFLNYSDDGKLGDDFSIDDTYDLHSPELFVPEGYGKHKSDSLTRTSTD